MATNPLRKPKPHAQSRTQPHTQTSLKQITSAGAVVFYRGDEIEYLLIRSNYWEFPKGMIDPHESEHAAALREVREETGLDVELVTDFCRRIEYYFRMRNNGSLVRKTVVFFLGKAETRTVQISSEHREAQWVTYERALELVPYENVRAILREAHQIISRM